MLKLLIFLISFSVLASTGAKPFLTTDISQVVTFDAPYDSKYGNGVRHRAIVRKQLGGEGYQLLLIEKIVPGKYGKPDKVLFSTEIFATELPEIKEYIVKLAEKSPEATTGCCDLGELAWKAEKLWFTVSHTNMKYQCATSELVEKDFKFECTELEVVEEKKSEPVPEPVPAPVIEEKKPEPTEEPEVKKEEPAVDSVSSVDSVDSIVKEAVKVSDDKKKKKETEKIEIKKE